MDDFVNHTARRVLAPPPFDPPVMPPPPRPDWLAALDHDDRYEWLRVQWTRCTQQPGFWYDHVKAEKIVAEWPRYFRLTGLRDKNGQPARFVLEDYQAAIVRMLFGWKKVIQVYDQNARQWKRVSIRAYKRLLLWMARKGGKTEFIASLALAFFVLEATFAGEGYVFARNEAQAATPFSRMKAMAGASPEMRQFELQAFAKSMFLPKWHSRFNLLSSTEKGKHGKIPSVILGDEIHEWKDRITMDVLSQGTASRHEAIEIYASTTGIGEDGPGPDLFEETQQIIDGRLDDPRTLAVCFACKPDDDPFDETNWHKANPLIGIAPTWEYMRESATRARHSSLELQNFKAYHLNIWENAVNRWINLDDWDASGGDDKEYWRKVWQKNLGRRCWLGLDLSSKRDFTALAALFEPDENGVMDLGVQLWQPQGAMRDMTEREREQRWRWSRNGCYEMVPGEMIVQQTILEVLFGIRETYQVQRIGFDKFMAEKFFTDAVTAGIPFDEFLIVRQGVESLQMPVREFEYSWREGLLRHGHHPVLRWMAGNVVMENAGRNDTPLPSKRASRKNIDGIAATLNAFRAMHEQQPVAYAGDSLFSR